MQPAFALHPPSWGRTDHGLMERFCTSLPRMSRAQDRYSRSPKKVTISGREVMVSADSDLDPEVIELMAAHQVSLAERIGEEYHLRGGYGSEPQNRALAAAFRAKGLIHTARAKSSNALGDIAKDGETPGDSLLNAASTAAC